jgi:uncharacterized protein YbjT (DUF2867 family)
MIAVTTPTGHVGSRVVRLLLQSGVRPRVLVRDPGRLSADVRERVDVRTGDLTDAAFVRGALAGVRSLFLVDPTPHTVADPVGDSDRFGALVADAVRDCGVGRAVFVSSGGAGRRTGAGHIDGLAHVEQHLDAIGDDVCHLRCGYFYTNLLMDADALAGGVLTTNADPDAARPWVDPRDIGDVAAARLLSDAWSGRVVQGVHGPEDLSWHRVAEVLTDVLERPVRVQPVTDDDVRTALRAAGLPPGAVDGIVGMTAGTRDLAPEQPRDVLTTTPTTLAAWAYAHREQLASGSAA